MAKPPWR
jgi:NB-ARC domain